LIDGLDFDPHAHFENWRARWDQWKSSKPARRKALAAEIIALRSEGEAFAAVAETLNRRGLYSPSGQAWTAEAVRKFSARHALEK